MRGGEQARGYQQGDPLKGLDWRAYARREVLLVREERQETTTFVNIFVDLRSSMHWPTDEILREVGQKKPQKKEIALRISLHLLYHHCLLGDRGLLTLLFDENEKKFYRPNRASDILSCYQMLEKNEFSIGTLPCLRHGFTSVDIQRYRCNTYFISDLIGEMNHRSLENEICLHILSSLEVNTSWMKDKNEYMIERPDKYTISGQDACRKGHLSHKITQWLSVKKAQYQGRYSLLTDQSAIRHYLNILSSYTIH